MCHYRSTQILGSNRAAAIGLGEVVSETEELSGPTGESTTEDMRMRMTRQIRSPNLSQSVDQHADDL